MKNSIHCFLAACGIALCLATTASAAFVPPSLPVGSQYQLVFVTAGVRDATSTDINDYNAFVTAQAALNPLLPATTWHAIGSTDAVDAASNAPSGGFDVYNTQGIQVTGSGGIYAFTLLNPIKYDQYGVATNGPVWTGSNYDGTGFPAYELGEAGELMTGFSTAATFGLWASDDPFTWFAEDELPLYALSEPITVVPEPSTVLLLSTALIMAGMRSLTRKRRLADRA
ncbi:MAG: PEP-CTERM sorting domain-containing protein [Pirellulales bacterium]